MLNLSWRRIAAWPVAPVLGVGALLLACALLVNVIGAEPANAVRADAAAPSGSAAAGDTTGAAPRGAQSPEPPPEPIAKSPAAAAVEAPPARRRCSGCGVVIAAREVPSDGAYGANARSAALPADFGSQWTVMAPARYSFTVLLENGAERVINDSNPLAWRIGERVMIIDGGVAGSR